ncbi:MAG: ABC transporter permease, partial [Planctomycetota bacterium]
PDKQVQPRFVPETHVENESGSERTIAELSERVRNGELFAFLVIGANSLSWERGRDSSMVYHSNSPTYDALRKWLSSVINEELRRVRFEEADLDRQLVERLTRRVAIESHGLATVDESGTVQEAEKIDKVATFAIPAISMFLLFALVMSSAPALMNNVLEEKMQKIAEVLVSAITPFQLMLGKLIGALLVSSTLSTLYLGAAVFLAYKFDKLHLISPSMLFWFLFFQFTALMIYGSVFTAIGAACNELRDAQTMMFPAMMLVMLPLFCWVPVLRAPESTFAVLLSLFPPATPMLMMLRISIPPGPAPWEIILSMILALGFSLMCVMAAAKIFRVGILAQGQAPSMRRMLMWVFSK